MGLSTAHFREVLKCWPIRDLLEVTDHYTNILYHIHFSSNGCIQLKEFQITFLIFFTTIICIVVRLMNNKPISYTTHYINVSR
jgi:hypothetical protein